MPSIIWWKNFVIRVTLLLATSLGCPIPQIPRGSLEQSLPISNHPMYLNSILQTRYSNVTSCHSTQHMFLHPKKTTGKTQNRKLRLRRKIICSILMHNHKIIKKLIEFFFSGFLSFSNFINVCSTVIDLKIHITYSFLFLFVKFSWIFTQRKKKISEKTKWIFKEEKEEKWEWKNNETEREEKKMEKGSERG